MEIFTLAGGAAALAIFALMALAPLLADLPLPRFDTAARIARRGSGVSDRGSRLASWQDGSGRATSTRCATVSGLTS